MCGRFAMSKETDDLIQELVAEGGDFRGYLIRCRRPGPGGGYVNHVGSGNAPTGASGHGAFGQLAATAIRAGSNKFSVVRGCHHHW
jgi:hypothetical protein